MASRLKMNRSKLLELLGERWFFGTQSVELYAAAIEKLDRHGHRQEAGRLGGFRETDVQHLPEIERYVQALGGDVRLPSSPKTLVQRQARVLGEMITEARQPSELLHVLLTCELEDQAAWELLMQLAARAGQADFVAAFSAFLANRNEHLRGVRSLVADRARHELLVTPVEEFITPLI